MDKYAKQLQQEKPQKKKRKAGALKGKIWMADDFDEPFDNIKVIYVKEKIMTIDSEILQTLVTMPEPLKQELLHYAKYLIENYSKDIVSDQHPQKKRRSGILKGTFVLPLPDDFDEPLEDFQEYME